MHPLVREYSRLTPPGGDSRSDDRESLVSFYEREGLNVEVVRVKTPADEKGITIYSNYTSFGISSLDPAGGLPAKCPFCVRLLQEAGVFILNTNHIPLGTCYVGGFKMIFLERFGAVVRDVAEKYLNRFNVVPSDALRVFPAASFNWPEIDSYFHFYDIMCDGCESIFQVSLLWDLTGPSDSREDHTVSKPWLTKDLIRARRCVWIRCPDEWRLRTFSYLIDEVANTVRVVKALTL